LILIHHYYDKKQRDQEDMIQALEYNALLTSFDPKGTLKAINQRRKKLAMQENSKDKEKYFKVNSNGQNEFGQHVNTSFLDDLKKYGGEQAIKAFENNEMQHEPEPEMNEDDAFLKQAKEVAKIYEGQIIPPKQQDTIIF
jgi:hypothetical protein